MKKIRNVAFACVATLTAIIPTAGCTSKPAASKAIETHQAGDLTITLLNDTGDLGLGKKDFVIEFKSSSTGKPVDVGRVLITPMMPMPGMAPMSADAEVAPDSETGRYRVTSNFGMAGTWRLSIQWDGPAGRGNTALSASVH